MSSVKPGFGPVLLGCLFLSTLASGVWSAESDEIEQDIAAMDEPSKKKLVQEMVGKIETQDKSDDRQTTSPVRKTAAAPVPAKKTEPTRAALKEAVAPKETAALKENIALDDAKLIKPEDAYVKPEETLQGNTVPITRQQDNHVLMTTGDIIYFPTPAFKTLQPEDRYLIFKHVTQTAPQAGTEPLSWYEQVGKLKILEIQGNLTMARIIGANDVIRQNDVVYFGNR